MYNGIFIKHSAKIKNAKLYIKFSFPRENVMRGVSDYRSITSYTVAGQCRIHTCFLRSDNCIFFESPDPSIGKNAEPAEMLWGFEFIESTLILLLFQIADQSGISKLCAGK